MSRTGYTGPKLPKSLLDQVGGAEGSRNSAPLRKDRRKAERQQKKSVRQQRPQRRVPEQERDIEDEKDSPARKVIPKRAAPSTKPLKSILKKEKPAAPIEYESQSAEEDSQDDGHDLVVSKTGAKAGLADDDAEIAALEKKLGIKGKALEEEGLDWLEGSDSDDGGKSMKRKRPEDSKWLRDKRLKATGTGRQIREEAQDSESDGMQSDENVDDDDQEIENPFSEDELSSDDFEGSEAPAPIKKKQRENPYLPPVTKDAPPTKYIPPSLRNTTIGNDEETLRQLKRQVQGLLNRLSEANMLSILQSLEDLYTKNARQHVTSTLIDLLIGLVSDPSILNDTFLILHAGFSAAVYKVIGTDFGAQLLEKLVESFDRSQARTMEGKQTLNLIAFLSNLYIFQVVGCAIVFDYIRLMLAEISENNTELLLRVIRTSGQQLRQDDPSALKDIVLLLQRSVAAAGEDNMSVRTKFMIETINNLKNNRMKTGAAASAIVAEHTIRVKKTIGSLNNSRTVKTTEPLSITLADIKNTEKRGKWWLVGASYNDGPSKFDNGATSLTKSRQDDLEGYESETPGKPNLHRLAREQGMNTSVRRAIFIALLSSIDFKEAHMKILKLHLKNKQMLEVPRVIVHCVGAEQSYNPYYALVARKFCGDRPLRKGLQFMAWDALRKMEGSDEDDGDGEEGEQMSIRRVVNLGKFYASLVAEQGLSIALLKKVEFGYMKANVSTFVEVFLTTIFVSLRRDSGVGVKTVFEKAAGAANIIAGLRNFIETTAVKAELAVGKREKRAVVDGCQIAVEALDEASRRALAPGDNDEDEDD